MDLVEAFGARSNASHGINAPGGLDFMERVESGASGDLVIIDPPLGGSAEAPQLFIDTAIRQASRGRGAVVCVAASNECVFVATARGYLLRYGWDENGNEKVTEVEVVGPKQAGDARICALFVDPAANHALLATRGGGGAAAAGAAGAAAEVYYVHRRWSRARAFTELRGAAAGALTAVGWCAKQGDDGQADPSRSGRGGGGSRATASVASGGAAGESCTGPILLGTESGFLLEAVLDERQKKEPPPRVLIEGVKDRRPNGAGSPPSPSPAFTGLQQVVLPSGRKALLAATTSHLRVWVAPTHPPASSSSASASAFTSAWQALFLGPWGGGPTSGSRGSTPGHASSSLPPPPLAVLEAVAPSAHSQLQLWWPVDVSEPPSRFAWLVGGVVYHGDLDWDAAEAAAVSMEAAAGGAAAAAAAGGSAAAVAAAATSAAVAMAGALVGSDVLSGVVSLPLEGSGADDGGAARSLVLTEFHLLLLAGDRLRLVNRVSGRTVAERAFRSPLTRSLTGEQSREIDGLVRDPVSGTTYMAVDEALYDVALQGESRGMWRVYLELQNWDAALRACSGPAQRDEVHRARAEAAAAAGDFRTAAVHFAKITDGRPPFEDVALRLSDCGDPAALQTFLATRLSTLAAAAGAAAGGGGGGGLFGGAPAAASASSGNVSGGAATAAGGGAAGAAAAAGATTAAGGPARAQCTLVAAWLTELLLDAINRALLEAGGESGEAYLTAATALRTHLSDWVHIMDPGTTVSLLASYGRLDELLQLAQLRGDHEGLLEQLMARPQPGGALRALAVLRSPAVSRELVYRFAPGLVAAAAEEAVDFFIAERPPLDPRRLLPALLRYGEPGSPPAARQHVLRYIEYAIGVLGTTDGVVHNLAAALYSLEPGEEGEAALLRYLTRGGRYGSTPLYDTQYALRLAQECGKPRAAVRLMCQLGMYPDAVRSALALDLGLAKGVAGEPEGDDALRRKLWLQVARHVVETGSRAVAAVDGAAAAAAAAGASADGASPSDPTLSHIRTAVEFLREADGLLRIEDILPFFPDFVTIDNFQAAICDSLERYGAAIASLKSDMEEATAIAEALRSDIQMLAARSAAVSLAQPCTRCGGAIGEPAPLTSWPQGGALPPFYVFPTGCAYHLACCAAEVAECVAKPQRSRISMLMSRLSKVRPGASMAPAYGGQPAAEVAALQEALAAELGSEDPRNGELTVALLERAFVEEADRAEAESWAI
ncbi:hypothetical protein HYH03_005142 [Edaphochlamys debaryana]|uniref:Pep3/Vps18 beta-propeller domain-containing protein n=1 Tax=Edaphochlamys debaryana TaxID=47281 RepID=A0A835YFN5_9CHLO|nr:hypothetical protein HYH03_005142 [Edaphochlamys debaryana]|eukprot:KAG2496729.1 hypothetical protein HYH03_005142 [Edaphochlamys debaryana]